MNSSDNHLIKNKRVNFLRFFLSVLLPLAFSLGMFYFLLHPPLTDFRVMVNLMLLSTVLSVMAAYVAYRLGWINRSLHIRWTLLVGYAFAGGLVFLIVWLIARLMFVSQHDLLLGTVLLVFATGIAMAVAFFLSEAITERIVMLNEASSKIAQGDLSVRVVVEGNDEMACLAKSFNDMAEQLQKAEKKQQELEVLRRDLIAWIGHDLRTPLTSIRAILEALADGVVDDPETVQRYLKTAQRDIKDLSLLIEDLFEMSQMDAGGLRLDCEMSSISDLISDTIESFSAVALQNQILLQGSVVPEADPIYMDSRRIGRVLSNLVTNAIRHTPSGGKVMIHAERVSHRIEVEVLDTGEGISAEDLPNIFDRFYRSEKSRNRSTGGAGLGLAIARGIVEAHGGEIQVSSELGKGTRFWFYLPDPL